jgi:hypothetical protein
MVKEVNFDENIRTTLESLKELLIVKGKEYIRNNDKYHNFNQGSLRTGKHPLQVLDGFMLKHEVSISDLTSDLISGKEVSREKVIEKFNDNLVYLLIKKSMILDMLYESNNE